MTRELIHQRWAAMTDNGKLDSSVQDAQAIFITLREALRARYALRGPPIEALTEAESEVIHQIKLDIVNGGRATHASW